MIAQNVIYHCFLSYKNFAMIKTTKERRIAMDLGNKICELRKLSGITQEQLAEKFKYLSSNIIKMGKRK